MLPLTADETIYKAYMHCMLSPGQSLLWAYSRSCLLCFSRVSVFCTLNQVSAPQSLRCTSHWANYVTCWEEQQITHESSRWEIVPSCSFIRLRQTQSLAIRLCPCSAPGRLFPTASLPRCSSCFPFPGEGWYKRTLVSAGKSQPVTQLPAKTRAWQHKCFFSSPFVGGRRH